MSVNYSLAAGRVAVVAMTALFVACEPGPVDPSGTPDFAVGDTNDNTSVEDGMVNVCAFPPVDNEFDDEMVATFEASATGGDVISGDFSIDQTPPLCIEAWNATDDSNVDVTATLLSVTEGYTLDRIVTLHGDGTSETLTDVESATVTASDVSGAAIWFKFAFADIPNGGGEGCTPGYWRQEHHFDSWTDYAPEDMFSDVFADAFPGETLLDVVWARGGGLNALGRSAVAALLNATSPGVDYDYTAGEVIDLFNDAFESGDKGTIENQKDVFDFLNNQGCDLN